MEPKSEGKKPDPLPDGGNDFWKVGKEQADNSVLTLKQVSCLSSHRFRRIGHNAECINCHVGYPLPVTGDVIDEHIYIQGIKVI